MLVYDDTENVEKVKIFDHGVDFEDPEDFGEFQLSYRTGDIVAPKIPGTEPLWLEAKHFVRLRVAAGAPPLTDGWAGPARWSPRSRPRRRRSTSRRRRASALAGTRSRTSSGAR